MKVFFIILLFPICLFSQTKLYEVEVTKYTEALSFDGSIITDNKLIDITFFIKFDQYSDEMPYNTTELSMCRIGESAEYPTNYNQNILTYIIKKESKVKKLHFDKTHTHKGFYY